jgi:hypothetical protein
MRSLHRLHPPISFMVQPTNHNPLAFEAQTKKSSWWFCGPNNQTAAAGFEGQPGKPERVVLRPNHKNSSHWFRGQTVRNRRHQFWVQTVAIGFEAKPGETAATGLEAKPGETIDLGFEAKTRNPCSSSPCAWYRPQTASPDLSISRPPSTRLVLDHPGPLHQVSYSYLYPRCCQPCHTYHLHIIRQANAFLHTKQMVW